jgi:hypothetical protein
LPRLCAAQVLAFVLQARDLRTQGRELGAFIPLCLDLIGTLRIHDHFKQLRTRLLG